MKILKADDLALTEASEIIRSGGLVAFPTETVYGLGANALMDSAVEKIYEAKGRPRNNPLIVHVADLSSLVECAGPLSAEQKKNIEKVSVFWPGPLTVVLPRASKLSDLVGAGGQSVALRIPDNEVARKLLEKSSLPLAAPSANPSGYISPTSAEHVLEALGSKVDLILDGGPCKVGIESTVLDLISESPTILRPGAVTTDQLETVLKTRLSVPAKSAESRSPGLLASHYAPRTPFKFVDQVTSEDLNKRLGYIKLTSGSNLLTGENIVEIVLGPELQDIAKRLYSALYELDRKGLDLIVSDRLDEAGLARAIMDRLNRAASK